MPVVLGTVSENFHLQPLPVETLVPAAPPPHLPTTEKGRRSTLNPHASLLLSHSAVNLRANYLRPNPFEVIFLACKMGLISSWMADGLSQHLTQREHL